MITIQEAVINSPNINSNQELIIKLRIKKEDYTQDMIDEIYRIKDSGTPMAIVMQEFQQVEQNENTIGKKRAKLAYLMEKYAEKEWTDIETEKQRLYSKWWIKSRSQLQEEHLDWEILSYQAWLNY